MQANIEVIPPPEMKSTELVILKMSPLEASRLMNISQFNLTVPSLMKTNDIIRGASEADLVEVLSKITEALMSVGVKPVLATK